MAKTRLFEIRWDNARIPSLSSAERFKERNSIGVQFHNGLVALSGGGGFNSMDELERMLDRYGKHTITYLDAVSVDVIEDDMPQQEITV